MEIPLLLVHLKVKMVVPVQVAAAAEAALVAQDLLEVHIQEEMVVLVELE